ncbi:SnoaL-like polyketide cyclase [Crocosphaera sp. XPORK-15E]|uniref:SnoaL-like polyketide cyclase n=1 Tax=Crocosphaera sp. XPORK-15E TaxID=3110247 RepID=UPI002B20E069|nr:SnoaL-like polyketide cyclase [Crocosphaera sp. XPORK-15E]MEA5537236.1 SnoaL-like polyketide cyclase [Crocosphaera sp. XPORK-15E]
MSKDNGAELPLWVQDRNTVLAHDEGVEWREGKRPDYSHTDQFLQKESQYNHPLGSLEAIAQNLVRTFEMEASHKLNPQQWLSIVADKFQMSSNGGPIYTAQDVIDQGTYNLFIDKTKAYDPTEENFKSSFELFHNAFPNGFLWELVEVVSGPPNVTFKWRHWGTFSGPYKEHQPTGETIEIVGLSVVKVTDDLKILSVEHYFDNSSFLHKLTSGCPFH